MGKKGPEQSQAFELEKLRLDRELLEYSMSVADKCAEEPGIAREVLVVIEKIRGKIADVDAADFEDISSHVRNNKLRGVMEILEGSRILNEEIKLHIYSLVAEFFIEVQRCICATTEERAERRRESRESPATDRILLYETAIRKLLAQYNESAEGGSRGRKKIRPQNVKKGAGKTGLPKAFRDMLKTVIFVEVALKDAEEGGQSVRTHKLRVSDVENLMDNPRERAAAAEAFRKIFTNLNDPKKTPAQIFTASKSAAQSTGKKVPKGRREGWQNTVRDCKILGRTVAEIFG